MNWEKNYPLILSLVITFFFYVLGFSPKIPGYEKVLDGIISFSSIVLGFLGALLAIILSISKSNVVKHLYNYVGKSGGDGKNILFGYFQQSLITGFIVVMLSICMYVVSNIKNLTIFYKIMSLGWVLITLFFILSSYRIISILMYTLFKHEEEPEVYAQKTQHATDVSALKAEIQQKKQQNT